VARNFTPWRAKGELDLVGYDGETLAIVEVRTRLARPGESARPEMSIGKEKHEVLVRTAEYFLRERHVAPCPARFDVRVYREHAWPAPNSPSAQGSPISRGWDGRF
jgi:putative endonuclease